MAATFQYDVAGRRWIASSRTHMGYVGFGATAREAAEEVLRLVAERPYNAECLLTGRRFVVEPTEE